MALIIKHATLTTDLSGSEKIGATEWDEEHTITGTLSADSVVDGSTNKAYTSTEQTKLSEIEATADVTDAANVGSAITGTTAKTTPVDADTVPLIDSAASNTLKKITWANLKATLKSYFDALYANLTHSHAAADITSGTIATARLGSGTASSSTVLFGNQTWGTLPDSSGATPALYNVLDYGAYDDGTHATETTAAFVAAIAAAEAARGIVYVPAGTFLVNTDAITITSAITVMGAGKHASIIKTTSSSGTAITVETSTSLSIFGTANLHLALESVAFVGVQILNTATTPDVTSKGVYVTDDTSENCFTRFYDCFIVGFSVALHFDNAIQWDVISTFFHTYRTYGILTTNTVTPDHGDWRLRDCYFWSFYVASIDVDTGAALRLEGGFAGCKISGNKFWGPGGSGGQKQAIWIYANMSNYSLYDGVFTDVLIDANDFDQAGFTSAAVIVDSAYGRSGEDGELYAGNRISGISLKGNKCQRGYLLDIRGPSGTIEDVDIDGGAITQGGGVLISGTVNGFSLTGTHFSNGEVFGGTVSGAPAKPVAVTGTATNARYAPGSVRGYASASDIPETLDASAIVATGSRVSGAYLEATNEWSIPTGTGGTDDFTLTTPTDLSARYRGGDLTGSATDPISTWGDASGNGLDLSQATSGYRPTIQDVTNGSASFRCAEFSIANNTKLSRSSVTFGDISGSNSFDAWFVVKFTDTDSINPLFNMIYPDGSANNTNNVTVYVGRGAKATTPGWQFTHGADADILSEAPTPSEIVDDTWLCIRLTRTGTTRTTEVNGSPVMTSSSGSSTINTARTADLIIGDYGPVPDLTDVPADCQIAEIIICKAAQDTDSVTSVESYLATVYGLTFE